MKYIDVRVRMPVKFLGQFVDEDIPPYANVIGFDKLEPIEPNQLSVNRGPKPVYERGGLKNGKYTPGKGTAAEAILKALEKEAMTYSEIMAAVKNKVENRAASSAIYTLRDKGTIKQQPDGKYAPTH